MTLNPDAGGDVEKREPTPYEKFVEATKRVVSIPIAEVDKAAKEWKH